MEFSKIKFFCLLITALSLALGISYASPDNPPEDSEEPSNLLVVWTSGDKDVAKNMVFMYTYNAKKNNWWKTVNFLVWGASTKLLSKDLDLQEYLRKMKEAGVDLYACKACADIYGVSDKLESFGINVKYMGIPLTQYLKNREWVTITF